MELYKHLPLKKKKRQRRDRKNVTGQTRALEKKTREE